MDWLEGPSLGDIARGGDPVTACDLLAETARRLHGAPRVSDEGLKNLNAVFAPLFECRFAPDCPGTLRQDMIRAIDLARGLLASQDAQVALHGDLHHDNVIQTRAGPRTIDAKGNVGDLGFELANALRHPKEMSQLVRSPGQIDRCIELYAAAMQVEPERLTRWVAAKCALSIFWRSDGAIENDAEADLLNLFLKRVGQ